MFISYFSSILKQGARWQTCICNFAKEINNLLHYGGGMHANMGDFAGRIYANTICEKMVIYCGGVERKVNFSNCVEALDSKDIKMIKPQYSGSMCTFNASISFQ